MLRRLTCRGARSATAAAAPMSGTRLTSTTPQPQNMNAQQQVLEIASAMSLLRMCYRSIDITVTSRHARTFLKRRLMELWAEKSRETDPRKQRLYMDMAGCFLQALHTDRNPRPGAVVHFQLSRRVAHEKKLQDSAAASATVHRRRRTPTSPASSPSPS